MTADKPLISVILPVYNGEKYLAEALQSVYDQHYAPMEIIAIDDGSTDGTAQILSQYSDRIQYLQQENQGPAAARNSGIQKAKGDFITFIDADDLWPDKKIMVQMNVFHRYPETDIVQGLVSRIVLPGAITNIKNNETEFEFMGSNLGAMIIRRSVFDKIGYFDESLTYHSDTDFWFRAREAGIRILVLEEVALIYRIHDANHTSGKNTRSLGFAQILKKSIDRRRHKSGGFSEIPELPVISKADMDAHTYENPNGSYNV